MTDGRVTPGWGLDMVVLGYKGVGSEGVYVVRFANNLRNIPRCEKR